MQTTSITASHLRFSGMWYELKQRMRYLCLAELWDKVVIQNQHKKGNKNNAVPTVHESAGSNQTLKKLHHRKKRSHCTPLLIKAINTCAAADDNGWFAVTMTLTGHSHVLVDLQKMTHTTLKIYMEWLEIGLYFNTSNKPIWIWKSIPRFIFTKEMFCLQFHTVIAG